MRSSIRDGWGILLNAANHLRKTNTPDDRAAIQVLEDVRTNNSNFRVWSNQWGSHHYPVVSEE